MFNQSYDRHPVERKFPHPVLVFIKLETGFCGSDGAEIELFYADADIETEVDNMALEHAQTYGYERPTYDVDEEEEEESGIEYSENIYGIAYLFHPDDLCRTHVEAEQILKWLEEVGAIQQTIFDYQNRIEICKSEIEKVMAYDFNSFAEMVQDNISGTYYVCEVDQLGGNIIQSRRIPEPEKLERTSVINKEKLFGKRGYNEGWTIDQLTIACRDSRQAETSLDEILGGDCANSEIVVNDLIAYIRELEQK